MTPDTTSSLCPNHIGIIMDGNGRWAKERGMTRSKGHLEGLQSAKRIVKAASDRKIPFISLYVFSTENWKRAEDEVSFLMVLIKQYLKQEYEFYRKNNIRIIHSGNKKGLPPDIQKIISESENDTADFSGLTLNLCINYGGKDEIIRAVNKLKECDSLIDETTLEKVLDQNMPAVDLVIRTGGEKRLSNFLIWQTAYSEFFFSDKYWPDWTENDLDEALSYFSSRSRRFGDAK